MRSMVKVKGHEVKVKCLIFNLVLENEVKDQDHDQICQA